MSSTFTRLFRYAKAIGAEAKENFTTEALRAAIETDSRPMLVALAARGWLVIGEPLTVRVETQLPVKGVGKIDLVLTATNGATSRVFWIEVKVDADESGDQLSNYANFIRTVPEAHRPMLLVLGPRSLGTEVPWLPWQELRNAIISSCSASPYWHDLKLYLEEIRMADSYDEVTQGDESTALPTARRLLGKTARVLTPFGVKAPDIWPGSTWPVNEAKVVDALVSSFITHGTLSMRNQNELRANVAVGVYHEPQTEDGWLGLWIWCPPKRVKERSTLLARVRSIEWGEDWSIDEGSWELFGAYRRLTSFVSHAEATEWLLARLEQLAALGVLPLLGSLGSEAPAG